MKFVEGVAFFSLMYILAKYLSDEFGFSDVEAGWLFAFCNGMQFPFALCLSMVLDSWGVRRMCIIGELFLICSRLCLWLTRSRILVYVVLLGLYPMGTAALLPALIVGVKRFSSSQSRPYAFSLFYTGLNVASLCVAGVLNVLRSHFHDVSDVYTSVLCLGCVSGLCGLICSPFLIERPSEEIQHLPTPAVLQTSPISALQSSTFWRFMAVVMSFVMIRLIFGHLNATVPKWMTREFGESTPYELYIGINPALIIVFVPICTRLCDALALKMETSLLVGAMISGFSPFILVAFAPNTLAVVVFVVIFSIGEAIWSPKLLEYTVAIPQEGREGVYVACGSAPLYLSKFMAGATSGYLLQTYCPRPDVSGNADGCQTRSLWLAIALTTSVTPVILLVFYSHLFTQVGTCQDEVAEDTALLGKRKLSC